MKDFSFYFIHLVKRSHYHLLQHTSEIKSFCLNIPTKAHALHRHYSDATPVCFVIFFLARCWLWDRICTLQESLLHAQLITNTYLEPLAVTPQCSTSSAFNPRPAIPLPLPAWPFAEVRSSKVEGRAWDTEGRHCHTASPPGLLLTEQPMAG